MVKTQQATNDACKPILAKEVTRREKNKTKKQLVGWKKKLFKMVSNIK